MYEETREQIKDIVFLARIEDIVSVAGIEDITYERFGGFALNKADLILAQLFTSAQLEEWKAGGKVGVIARDQELPDIIPPTAEEENTAHCCQWQDREWYYAGQGKSQEIMVNDNFRRVVE